MKTVSPITPLTATVAGYLSDTEVQLGGNVCEVNWSFPRKRTMVISQSAAGVLFMTDCEVPKGGTVFVDLWKLDVSGPVAWTDPTATKVSLKDTSGLVIADIAKAALTANATVWPWSAGVTLGTAFRQSTGLTPGAGFLLISDAAFGAGSMITFTVFGRVRTTVPK